MIYSAFILERLEIRRLLSAIVSGQTIAGNILTMGQQDTYTFSVAAGNTFKLSVGDPDASSNYRAEMTVTGPGGGQVAAAGNGFTSSSAGITYNVPATGSGMYTVIVQSDIASALGAYDLDLVVAPATQAADSDGDGGVITSGQTKAGAINHYGDLDVYTFNAAAGNTFQLSVGDADSNSNFRSEITVYDPNGNQVGASGTGFPDDSAGVTYTVPGTEAGTYTVVVQSDTGNTQGTYDLDLVVAPATQAADAEGDGGAISSGQTKAGTINHYGDLDVYTFSAAAGNTFKLSVGDADSNSNYRSQITVYDPNGNQIAAGATGFTDNSETVTYSVPGTGSGMYSVVVQSNGGSTLGTYDLDLVVAPATQAADSDGDGGAITSGQTKGGTINHYGDLDVYTFSATAGNTFRLSVGDANSNSNYRPQITVYDPNGNQVGASATGFTDTSVGVTYTVPGASAGTYTAVVQSDGGSTLGTYDLDLVVTPATQAPDSDGDGGPLTSGQTKAGTINHYGDLDVYTFNASAGNMFQLSVGDADSTSNFRPQITAYGPSGNQVGAALTGFTDTSEGITYVVPGTGSGMYTVIVQSDGGNTLGTYDLDLVIAPATQAPDLDGDGGPITSGQTKAGTINHYGDLDVYTFSAAAGNTFKLSVGDSDSNSAYRPQLTVYGPNGSQVGIGATGFTDTSEAVTFSVPGTGRGHLHGRRAGGWRQFSGHLRSGPGDRAGDAGPRCRWGRRADLQRRKPLWPDRPLWRSGCLHLYGNRRKHRQTGRRGCGCQHQLPAAVDGL